MKILFLGDIVGKTGVKSVVRQLPRIISRESVSFVVANCENIADGIGVDAAGAQRLLDAGVDVLTSGNHIWSKRGSTELVEDERLLRPANYPPGTPGRGFGEFTSADGVPVYVMNLMGRIFMDPVDCPFQEADRLLKALPERAPVIVDMHCEATSEKSAMGWYLAGRVSAVFGSHTHVQTADECLLPGETAYLTDAGMCGSSQSVIGMAPDAVVERFVRRMPTKLTPASAQPILQGAMVDIDPSTGAALAVTRLREKGKE